MKQILYALIPALLAVIPCRSQNTPGAGNKWKVSVGQSVKPDDNGEYTNEQYIEWGKAVMEANRENSIPQIPFSELSIAHYDSAASSQLRTQVVQETAATPQLRSSSYSNAYVPTSYTIDKSKTAGEIPFSSDVAPNGALTYNVPIEIYPGINGCQPNLSLAYNSFAGNGIMGAGWNLGGLSVVTRTAKNLYYDSKVEGTLINNSGPFLLDGMRLIEITKTSSQIEYESEQGRIKATAYLSGSVVRYFTVRYPNGNTGTYGYATNYTSRLSYPLTEMKDRFGNTISYQYDFRDEFYTPEKITYSNASIEFQYQNSRSDAPFSYQSGTKVTQNRLLTGITCKYGSNVRRTYSLSYSIPRDCNMLNSISLSAGGLSVNPLKFYYGENNTASGYTYSQTQLIDWYDFTSQNQIRTARGKFDYGTDDDGIISFPNENPYWQHYRNSTAFRHSQDRFDNNYTGDEKIFLYAGLNDTYALPMPNLTTGVGFINIFCANLDGKWEDEVIKVNNTVSGSYDQIIFNVYAPNLYTGLGYKYTRTFNFSTILTDADGGKSIHPKFYFTGDFNGDGKMEVFAVSCQHPFGWTDKTSSCYLFDLEGNRKLYDGKPTGFAYNVGFTGTSQGNPDIATQNTDRLLVMDYDGDGKSDICLINNQGTHIYTFDVSGTSYSMRKVATYSGITKSGLDHRELLPGEFNGDGKTDLLVSPSSQSGGGYEWAFYYSKGNGQFDKKTALGTYNNNSESFYTQDINGDGITDLLKNIGGGYFTYLIKPYSASISSECYTSFTSGSIIIPVDINSSNHFGRIVSLKGGIATKQSFLRNDAREKLLTGAVNSLGVIDRNHYRKLDETGYFYQKGSGAVFPYINFSGPIHVPTNREKYYDNRLYEDIDFSYENAVVHVQGLGFRGFGKLTTYDMVRGRSFSQTFDPYRFGVLTVDESPFSKTTNTWTVSVQSNKTVKATLTNRSVQDKLKGTTATASYTYDTYGNPTQETINFGDNITQTTASTYVNSTGTPYILGFLTNQTVTVSRNGSSNSKRTQVGSYNSLLMPTLKYTYANGNRTSQTGYSYDGQGNITQDSVKTYTSATWITNSYQYDSYGRITRETDPLGLYVTYEYSALTGLLSTKKNHKSQATSFSHDGLERTVYVSYPGSIIESTSYAWSSGAGLYAVSSTATGKPATNAFYNAFGQKVRTSLRRYDGSLIHTDKFYDSYGRLQKESLPFNGSSPSYWNTYSYDGYDRPVSVSKASGKTTSYSYSGRNVTVTNDGIASTSYYDAQGNLTSVSDPAGTITYNLRPDGQPSSITAPGSVTTSFGYDSYGRRTSINDPSAGNRSFGYDAAGNTNRETDADGRVKNMTYDACNRLISITLPEFSTLYAYNADGQLSSERSNNSTSRTYQYDTYGRLYKDRDSVPDGKWIEKTYAYSSGNVSSIQYTSQSGSIGTESMTYANGHLKEIKIGSTSIWKLNGENNFGQPTAVATGQVSRTYSYDSYGIPNGRTAASSAGGTFQSHTYSFDAAKGNLTYRKDNTRSIQENFTYDNLNRLTGFAGKSVGYDIKGNITQRSDVGTFFLYNTPGKPYAISEIDPGTNTAIPMRNQYVTYTSFERPATISENNYTASFTYDVAGDRAKMQVMNAGSSILTRYYLGGVYEIDVTPSDTKQRLYLGGNAYS
ncbi:MAG: FG-GAP-like repeat-containing protein, partial [Dysgonamonadaceae bacterium]|nr:FG-GAP-like repeat-containing protein [Dysgonamonadaceae bacterium]